MARFEYTQISVESGFIAWLHPGATYFHAESLEKAIQGVWRKFKIEQFYAKESKQRAASLKRKKMTYLDSIPEDLMLSFRDSVAAGNCKAGTTNFINTNNLNSRKQYPARLIYKLAVRKGTEYNVRRIIDFKMRTPIIQQIPFVGYPSLWQRIKNWFN